MKTLIVIIVSLFITTLSYGQTTASGNGRIEDPIEFIKKESEGGKLDFNAVLEKDDKGFYLYDGVAYNKKDFAIFLWGQAVKRQGITSSKRAIELWEDINKRELTDPERKALTKGFKAKIK